MIWLHLATEPPRAFYLPGDAEPDTAAVAVPSLVGIGTIRRPLGGENANVSIEIDNARGNLTALFADPPLLVGATLYRDAEILLAGTVGSIAMGSTIQVGVEA